MGMALREDVVNACRKSGTEKPIDLAFLSTQTMGDAALEMEILGLFASQVRDFSSQLQTAMNTDAVRVYAHTLKGASRSIGAVRLAHIASECEHSGQIDVSALRSEFDRICQYIDEIQKDR